MADNINLNNEKNNLKDIVIFENKIKDIKINIAKLNKIIASYNIQSNKEYFLKAVEDANKAAEEAAAFAEKAAKAAEEEAENAAIEDAAKAAANAAKEEAAKAAAEADKAKEEAANAAVKAAEEAANANPENAVKAKEEAVKAVKAAANAANAAADAANALKIYFFYKIKTKINDYIKILNDKIKTNIIDKHLSEIKNIINFMNNNKNNINNIINTKFNEFSIDDIQYIKNSINKNYILDLLEKLDDNELKELCVLLHNKSVVIQSPVYYYTNINKNNFNIMNFKNEFLKLYNEKNKKYDNELIYKLIQNSHTLKARQLLFEFIILIKENYNLNNIALKYNILKDAELKKSYAIFKENIWSDESFNNLNFDVKSSHYAIMSNPFNIFYKGQPYFYYWINNDIKLFSDKNDNQKSEYVYTLHNSKFTDDIMKKHYNCFIPQKNKITQQECLNNLNIINVNEVFTDDLVKYKYMYDILLGVGLKMYLNNGKLSFNVKDLTDKLKLTDNEVNGVNRYAILKGYIELVNENVFTNIKSIDKNSYSITFDDNGGEIKLYPETSTRGGCNENRNEKLNNREFDDVINFVNNLKNKLSNKKVILGNNTENIILELDNRINNIAKQVSDIKKLIELTKIVKLYERDLIIDDEMEKSLMVDVYNKENDMRKLFVDFNNMKQACLNKLRKTNLY